MLDSGPSVRYYIGWRRVHAPGETLGPQWIAVRMRISQKSKIVKADARILIRFSLLYKQEVFLLFDFERFEALRKEKGITKKSIADRLDRKPSLCQDWKQGKSTPNPAQLAVVADILGTTTAYLTGESDQKERPTAGTGDGLSTVKRELLEIAETLPDEKVEQLLRLVKAALEL